MVNLVKQVIKSSVVRLFISMSVQKKSFESPDEIRSFNKSRVELVKLGDNQTDS